MAKRKMAGEDKMTGMKMMGRMKTLGAKEPTEPLPAFAGERGIYQIGGTGFFLDQADHVSLTPQQQAALNQINDEATSHSTALDEQIVAAEEELGMLTGSDRPDAAKIEAQIRRIERLHGDQRVAFIRFVGHAAGVLTDQQRKTLVGQRPKNRDNHEH